MPVQDVYSITGIGTVPVGRVETGVVKAGDNVIFMPSNKTAEVKSIEMHHVRIPQAEPGDNIGMNVRGIAKTDVHRGDVVGPVRQSANRGQRVHRTNNRDLPPNSHRRWIHASSPLPHRANRMQILRTNQEDRPSFRTSRRRETQLPKDRRRSMGAEWNHYTPSQSKPTRNIQSLGASPSETWAPQ